MPQLEVSTFLPQLVWLAITFVILYLLMAGIGLPRVGGAIEARRRRVDDDLARAAQLKTEAEAAGLGAEIPPMTSRRGRIVYKITADGKERFQDLLAQAGPETFDDPAFGVHFAFFARTDQQTRIRILEGRRRRVEERREGLRDVLARAAERLDAYTLELQRHGLDSCEREVRWLEELIATERSGQTPGHADAGGKPKVVPPSDTPER